MVHLPGASAWKAVIIPPDASSTRCKKYAAILWRESHSVECVLFFSFWRRSLSKQRFVNGQKGGSPASSPGTMQDKPSFSKWLDATALTTRATVRRRSTSVRKTSSLRISTAPRRIPGLQWLARRRTLQARRDQQHHVFLRNLSAQHCLYRYWTRLRRTSRRGRIHGHYPRQGRWHGIHGAVVSCSLSSTGLTGNGTGTFEDAGFSCSVSNKVWKLITCPLLRPSMSNKIIESG
jgi:hypothetical protein